MKKISCKKTERMIPAFLKYELSNSDLMAFMNHVEHCTECKEELSIQFLVSEGINTLNDGESFNLSKAFEERMNKSNKYIGFVRRLVMLRNISIIILAIAMLFCAYFGYVYVFV